MNTDGLIQEYRNVCKNILEIELELFTSRKDLRLQELLRTANQYKDALWEAIIQKKGDPYN